MTRLQAKRWLEDQLARVTDSYQAEARQLLCHVLKCAPLDLIIDKEADIDSDAQAILEELLNRRMRHEPLQYILGSQAFMGVDFEVTSHVLIPRPETEILVERVIKDIKTGDNSHVLDMGTGSGAIAVSLAYHLKNITVTAVDLSSEALAVAKRNAISCGVEARIQWVQSNFFENVQPALYQVIVSNPPYIPMSDLESLQKEVRLYEPHLALFAEEDGLAAYQVIIPTALNFLADGGRLYFEAGHDQAAKIKQMMDQAGYIETSIFPDLNGIERFICGKKPISGG